MTALLKEHYAGLTVEQAIRKYAPSNENDCATYIAHVCEWTGCKPTDLIDGYLA